MEDLAAVVLAAGLGKRMRSELPKVLHPLGGRPMLLHVLDALAGLGVGRVVVVVGYQAAKVQQLLGDRVEYAYQQEQLGTGHALLCAESSLEGFQGSVIVLNGDTPLLLAEDLRVLVEEHRRAGSVATLITAVVDDPAGYGRIIRDGVGRLTGIVEEADATPAEKTLREVNAGIYCFEPGPVFQALGRIGRNNAQGEHYLVDAVRILLEDGYLVATVQAPDPVRVTGINDRRQLAEAEAAMRHRVINALMQEGVTIVDPNNTYIHPGVSVGRDTVIHPFCFLGGQTVVGSGCTIGPGAHIHSSRIGDGATVLLSVVSESVLEENTRVGPFSHLRPGTLVAAGARIGNFAEVKASHIGRGSKVPHHSYVGDSVVGEGVNIGAGAVTVNFDGVRKHRTHIGDHCFVGCNANLIAPVVLGPGAYVAAGSTITREVPGEALGVARTRQVNREGWARRRKGKE